MSLVRRPERRQASRLRRRGPRPPSKSLRQPHGRRGSSQRPLALREVPREFPAPKRRLPPEQGAHRFSDFSLDFLFSLSSDLRYSSSRKHKAASVALAPLKAVKRGAQSTPGSARLKSPPLSHEEEGLPREGEGQEMGTPRPQGLEETVLALGAVPPSGGADLGGVARPVQSEEGRDIVASNVAPLGGPHGKGPARPEAPAAGGEGDAPWSKSGGLPLATPRVLAQP